MQHRLQGKFCLIYDVTEMVLVMDCVPPNATLFCQLEQDELRVLLPEEEGGGMNSQWRESETK